MAINYPSSLDSLTNPTSANNLGSPDHAAQHANANDAVEALEAKVGADSSAVTTSHDYKLSAVTSTAKAVSTAGTQTVGGTKTFAQTVQTVTNATDGATVTFDLSLGNVHTVTLGGNRTLAISNEVTGQCFIIELLQDGTGSRTVTWFSTLSWAGGTAPTLTTTASKKDIFGFRCTASGTYWGVVIGQNI
jgi:hypothetical protein